MIDYLELLLEEQEQEATQGDSVEMKRVLLATQLRRAVSSGDTDADPQGNTFLPVAGGSVPINAVALSGSRSNQHPLEYLPGQQSFAAERPQAEGILALVLQRQENPLSSSRPHSWAAGLYQTSLAAAQAAAALRHGESRMFNAAEPAASAASLSAARLDEMFARDARRYDNGFSMY